MELKGITFSPSIMHEHNRGCGRNDRSTKHLLHFYQKTVEWALLPHRALNFVERDSYSLLHTRL